MKLKGDKLALVPHKILLHVVGLVSLTSGLKARATIAVVTLSLAAHVLILQ